MINQKLLEDDMNRVLIQTEIDKVQLLSRLNTKDLCAEIYLQLAIMVAQKVFEQLGPAIDEAVEKIKIGPDTEVECPF